MEDGRPKARDTIAYVHGDMAGLNADELGNSPAQFRSLLQRPSRRACRSATSPGEAYEGEIHGPQSGQTANGTAGELSQVCMGLSSSRRSDKAAGEVSLEEFVGHVGGCWDGVVAALTTAIVWSARRAGACAANCVEEGGGSEAGCRPSEEATSRGDWAGGVEA